MLSIYKLVSPTISQLNFKTEHGLANQIIIPFHRWEIWNSKRLVDLSWTIQLIIEKDRQNPSLAFLTQVSVYFGHSEVLDFKIEALNVLLRQASVKYEHISAKLFLSFTACFISYFKIIPLESFVLLACCESLMI